MLIFLAVFLASGATYARFLPIEIEEGPISVLHHFVAPNEMYPQTAKAIYESAPAGVYVSVGTERGFIGASLAGNTTALLLADVDQEVVRFNRFNVALLEMAQNREHYLFLRLKASYNELSLRSIGHPPEDKHILSRKNFEAFRKQLDAEDFRFFHRAENPQGQFRDANYLFDDALFSRVQNLAKNHLIQVVQLDFRDRSHIDKLISALKRKKQKISVLDISNSWWYVHMSHRQVGHLLHAASKVAEEKAIVLATDIDFEGHKPYLSFPLQRFSHRISGYILSAMTFKEMGKLERHAHNFCWSLLSLL